MNEEELSTLQRESDFLCKEVAHSGRFADIVYELKIRQVISHEVVGCLLRSEETKTSKMHKLLGYLQRGPSETFRILIDVLIQHGLSLVAKRLDPRAFEYHSSILGGSNDRLDAQRFPDLYGSGEPPVAGPMYNLPLLPRRSSSSSSIPESDRNGNDKYDPNKPLVIDVKPASVYGGSLLEESELYKNKSMPRGLVFLANYKNFLNDENPERKGSQKDVSHLCSLFNQMGYKVPDVHVNLSKYDTIKALRDFRNNEEHKNVDSCIVVIMSHGRDGKSFYTSDNQHLTINDVVERFSNSECESLRGKPKIFIFQYCRGREPDIGVRATPVIYKDSGLPVETDAAYTSVVDRDPTFSDMYIVYSTLEGFASFRHPERGSWLMEAICNVFMKYSHNEELDSLMKRVSRQVRGNFTDEGNKQVCEFVQRGFDRHFYFNPSPLNSTDRDTLSMRSIGLVLSESLDNLGAASPGLRCSVRPRRIHQASWSRGSSPDPYLSPSRRRHRNLSGASNSSDYTPEDLEPLLSSSESVIIHPRVRRRSGGRRILSENINFLQPSFIQNHMEPFNRSFSENILESQETSPGFAKSPSNEVFGEEDVSDCASLNNSTYDTVDNPKMSCGKGEAKSNGENPDVNMNQNGGCDEEGEHRHSIKRQLSFPSTTETLSKINDVKKFLQVHDSDPQTIEKLLRVESFVNKKKYEGKRRKKEDAHSLDY
ncbi:uncharacterized protein LOC135195033 isoform X3 [Macrobrachium nipponense]